MHRNHPGTFNRQIQKVECEIGFDWSMGQHYPWWWDRPIQFHCLILPLVPTGWVSINLSFFHLRKWEERDGKLIFQAGFFLVIVRNWQSNCINSHLVFLLWNQVTVCFASLFFVCFVGLFIGYLSQFRDLVHNTLIPFLGCVYFAPN